MVPASLFRMTDCCLALFFLFQSLVYFVFVSKRKHFQKYDGLRASQLTRSPSPEAPCPSDSDSLLTASDFVRTSVLSLRDHVKVAPHTYLGCSLVRAEHAQAPAWKLEKWLASLPHL